MTPVRDDRPSPSLQLDIDTTWREFEAKCKLELYRVIELKVAAIIEKSGGSHYSVTRDCLNAAAVRFVEYLTYEEIPVAEPEQAAEESQP